jgi:hypothetical protein
MRRNDSGIGSREGIVGKEVEREEGREGKRKMLTGQMSGLTRFSSACSDRVVWFTALGRQLLRDSTQEIAYSEPREHRTSAKDDRAKLVGYTVARNREIAGRR